jgi:hypothetical protein
VVVRDSKLPQKIPTLSIPRSSKIYPNVDFGFEKRHLATLKITPYIAYTVEKVAQLFALLL